MPTIYGDLGVSRKEIARVVYEVTTIMGKPATYAERIRYLEERFKGRALLLAVFQLGWESAIADAYHKGFNEAGVFEPSLCGAYVADQFNTGNMRYNEILEKGENAIKEIEKAFEMFEKMDRDRSVV